MVTAHKAAEKHVARVDSERRSREHIRMLWFFMIVTRFSSSLVKEGDVSEFSAGTSTWQECPWSLSSTLLLLVLKCCELSSLSLAMPLLSFCLLRLCKVCLGILLCDRYDPLFIGITGVDGWDEGLRWGVTGNDCWAEPTHLERGVTVADC